MLATISWWHEADRFESQRLGLGSVGGKSTVSGYAQNSIVVRVRPFGRGAVIDKQQLNCPVMGQLLP